MTEVNIIGAFMFILGAILGSFLNVCIVRLPNEKSIVTPASHCIHCKQLIAWYDNKDPGWEPQDGLPVLPGNVVGVDGHELIGFLHSRSLPERCAGAAARPG